MSEFLEQDGLIDMSRLQLEKILIATTDPESGEQIKYSKIKVGDEVLTGQIDHRKELNGVGRKFELLTFIDSEPKIVMSEGQFKDNELNGFGRKYYSNGDFIFGYFYQDELHGYGNIHIKSREPHRDSIGYYKNADLDSLPITKDEVIKFKIFKLNDEKT